MNKVIYIDHEVDEVDEEEYYDDDDDADCFCD